MRMWENAAAQVGFELVAPTARVHAATSRAARASASWSRSPAQSVAMGVIQPAAGTWTLRIPDDSGLGAVSLAGYKDTVAPTIELEWA